MCRRAARGGQWADGLLRLAIVVKGSLPISREICPALAGVKSSWVVSCRTPLANYWAGAGEEIAVCAVHNGVLSSKSDTCPHTWFLVLFTTFTAPGVNSKLLTRHFTLLLLVWLFVVGSWPTKKVEES